MPVVRLMERPDSELSVLEQSAQELARARRLGARVFDVACDRPSRAEAERTLKVSRRPVPPVESDEAGHGRVLKARGRVQEVELT